MHLMPPKAARFASVDALRGVIIALMILVNSMGGMTDVPGWTQHLPSETDGYTVTDLVFPLFLFIVGVSIPLSLASKAALPVMLRLRALGRIIPRTLGLLVLGVVFVNGDRYDDSATGMRESVWMSSVMLAAIVLWGRFPRPESPGWRRAEAAWKIIAALGLGWLLLVWRGRMEDGSTWLQPSWWGILGLIGWSYLVCSIIYLLTGGNATALMGLMALMVCVYIGDRHGRTPVIWEHLSRVWSTGSFFGSQSAIVTAGMVAGTRLLDKKPDRHTFFLLFGAGLWLAGWLLRPLHGYHKNAGTESWGLVSAGIGTLLLLVFHRALDVFRRKSDTDGILVLAGRNALLAYLLPELVGSLSGLAGIDLMPWWGRGGMFGMANAAAFTALMIWMAAAATRLGFVLRL